jgi:hypothetical protein
LTDLDWELTSRRWMDLPRGLNPTSRTMPRNTVRYLRNKGNEESSRSTANNRKGGHTREDRSVPSGKQQKEEEKKEEEEWWF